MLQRRMCRITGNKKKQTAKEDPGTEMCPTVSIQPMQNLQRKAISCYNGVVVVTAGNLTYSGMI